MKKISIFLIILTVVFSAALISIHSAPAGGDYVAIQSPVAAKVIEVIDADSLLVEITGSGSLALVHMVGIDSLGSNEGFAYVTAKLLGNLVLVVPDAYVRAQAGRWNYAHVFLGETNLSEDLAMNGYAKINPAHAQSTSYGELIAAERAAKNSNLGLWQTGGASYAYTGDMVNINTASKAELSENLDLSDRLAGAISDYRGKHPFQTIYDIKFVDGMTKALFEDIRHRIVISTNIEEASAEELAMLIGLDEDDAEKIIDYRDQEDIKSLADLYRDGVIRQSQYKENEPFIARAAVERIDYTVPEEIVNINTATEAQLRAATLTQSQINKIVDYRADYSFKTMRDVTEALNLSKTAAAQLSDNLRMKTDINNATQYELRSLFGKHGDAAEIAGDIIKTRPLSSASAAQRAIPSDLYPAVKDFIVIGEEDVYDIIETNYVNINTAGASQLTAIGLTTAQAAKIAAAQPNMMVATDIPVDVRSLGLDKNVALFTNINRASAAELKTLSPQITDSVAESICTYRGDQPFGSLEEFREFLVASGRGYIYTMIENAITVE